LSRKLRKPPDFASEYSDAEGFLNEAELERISGKTGSQIDELAAILARRHEERQAGIAIALHQSPAVFASA
jgi:hypothetical protein